MDTPPSPWWQKVESIPGLDRSHLQISERNGRTSVCGSVHTLVERRALERGLDTAGQSPTPTLEVEVRLAAEDRVADAELVRRIQASLHWHAQLHDLSLCISASAGRVGLAGDVPSVEHAAAAQAMVESMRGVVEVSSSLRIVSNAARVDLATRVRQKLGECSGVDTARVSVDCRDGSVILEGEIGDWSERRAITDAVRSIPGVQTIDDRLLTDD